MSKEMAVIVLGVWVIIATQLGIPFHPWLSLVLVFSGILIVITGFLLRADAMRHGHTHHAHRENFTFVENGVDAEHHAHEHKEGIGSFN